MTDWTKYGQIVSPIERLGYNQYFYQEGKKKDLFLDTKNYITKRNEFIGGVKPLVDNAWKDVMEKNSDIPILERTRIADNFAKKTFDLYQSLADELYPNANLAYKQQGDLNIAQKVIEGNVIKAKSKGKRGRPKKKAQ